jgi:hypothetical protein
MLNAILTARSTEEPILRLLDKLLRSCCSASVAVLITERSKMPDKRCQLNRSTQHFLEVCSQEFEILIRSIKRGQEKNGSAAAGVFLAVQPAPWSRSVPTFRSVSSGRWAIPVALLGFSASGFHRFCTRKAIRFETNQQYGCQLATVVPRGTRCPELFRAIRGGFGPEKAD